MLARCPGDPPPPSRSTTTSLVLPLFPPQPQATSSQIPSLCRYHNVGILVLFLHDINDVQLEFTKLNVYFKHRGGVYHRLNDIISDIGCLTFSVSWLVAPAQGVCLGSMLTMSPLLMPAHVLGLGLGSCLCHVTVCCCGNAVSHAVGGRKGCLPAPRTWP